MKRKKRKKNTGEPQQVLPAEEFTVDEILSQFWEEYEDADDPDSAEPDLKMPEAEDLSPSADSVPAVEEDGLTDGFSDEDLWADVPVNGIDSDAGNAAETPAPAAPYAPAEAHHRDAAEEMDELNFDLPYSLRDIMQEFWDAGQPAAADEERPVPEDTLSPEEPSQSASGVDWSRYDLKPGAEYTEPVPAENPEDDSLDFSLGALLWGIDDEPEEKPVPETAADGHRDEAVSEAEDTSADARETIADTKPDSAASQTATPVTGKKVGKVWEEFPDEATAEDEPFVDTLDYSALFKMFAEEPQTGEQGASEETPPENDTWPDSTGLNTEEILASIEKPGAEPAAAKQPGRENDAPLLADRNDEMDFRDILREFMLGDQHPIYSGTPGIDGRAAEDTHSAAEPLADDRDMDDAAPAVRPSRRREYTVKEEFPPEQDGLTAGREETVNTPPAGSIENPEQSTFISDETNAAVDESADEAAQEPEESGFRSRLKNILAGRSLRTGRAPKQEKALNEPSAYVGYEDYLPDEEQAKSAEDTADRPGGAHAAPAGEEFSDSFGGSGNSTAVPGDAADSDRSSMDDLSDEELLDYEADFPGFGQWILNELMNIWIRLNGVGDRQSTATMEDEREDPGPEMNVAAASRYYGSQVTMLRMRFQLGLALLAVLAYITLGFPVSGMLKTAKVASAVCLGLQLTILLLCLDVMTNALMNIFRGRFGADGLALLSCIVTSFDALVVAVGGFGTPHIPLCLFSSLAMMGILFSSLLSARALRKSTRVPAIGKRAYCVTAEEGVRGGRDITLLKSIRPVSGFVRRAEDAPPDETLFNRFAALELLAVLVLSLLTGIVKHSMRDFLYILSAMLTCTVPVTALSAFALPFFVGSQRIFSSGAAVAGWSGIHDIGASRNLIVTDRDLFPEETVSIETVRIFADESAERVIAYAGTMIAASGSGLGHCFSELMERNGCHMRRVEDFQWLSGGGLQGHIEGHTVLCGSSDLMQLMNVKVPYRLVDRTTVLLSIDGVLYGIFKVVYTAQPEIRSALQELIASNRHPIFAIRDFNVTPNMLHEVFDVATDGYDFPPYGDRFRISEAQPSDTSKVSAVICREGLGPLTHLADTGRSMYVAVRLNLLITVLTAVLGTLLVFIRLIGPGLLNAWLPFVLMILDMILVTMITVFMRF